MITIGKLTYKKRKSNKMLMWVVLFFVIIAAMFYFHLIMTAKIFVESRDSNCILLNDISFTELLRVPFKYKMWTNSESSNKRLCWRCPRFATCKTSNNLGMIEFTCPVGFTPSYKILKWFEPYCKEDIRQQSVVDSLISSVEVFLADRMGRYICNNINIYSNMTEDITSPSLTRFSDTNILETAEESSELLREGGITELDLRNIFRNRNGRWNEDNRFESYFTTSIRRIIKDKNSNVRVFKFKSPYSYATEDISKWILISKTPAIGIGCKARFFLIRLLHEYAANLVAFFIFVLSFVYLKHRLSCSNKRKVFARQILDYVIIKLVEQESLNREDPVIHSTTIPINQLRDTILADYLPKEKNMIWREVMSLIQQNSNIRESIASFKGEEYRALEWLGQEVLSPKTKLK